MLACIDGDLTNLGPVEQMIHAAEKQARANRRPMHRLHHHAPAKATHSIANMTTFASNNLPSKFGNQVIGIGVS